MPSGKKAFFNIREQQVFLKNLLAYGASETGAKLSRFLVVVIMARTLDAKEIGFAATALAVSEIVKSLTENGVVQRIISAPCSQLAAICKTAQRIVWVYCTGLFMLQVALAAALFSAGLDIHITLMVAILGLEYLFMPGGLIHCALAMRKGQLQATAGITAAQNIGSNISLAALLLIWPTAWMLVVAKLLTAPVWLLGMRHLHPFKAARHSVAAPFKPFLKFGSSILGVEILKALRLQGDKLVIGALMGAEALGVYFFAINAGLGIALSFTTAFSTVLFPTLCASEKQAKDLGRAIILGLAVVVPITIIQALAAPFYINAVFGLQWVAVAPLVSILCFAAIPAVLWAAASQWMRANGRAGAEFKASLIMTTLSITAIAAAAPHGLTTVAWTVLATAILVQITASIPAFRVAFEDFTFAPKTPKPKGA